MGSFIYGLSLSSLSSASPNDSIVYLRSISLLVMLVPNELLELSLLWLGCKAPPVINLVRYFSKGGVPPNVF